MHDIDPVTNICKKCGMTKRNTYIQACMTGSEKCLGREVDEEEFVRQTQEVEPDVVIDTVP